MVHVEEVQARLGDEATLAKLLDSIPLPHSVCPLLRKPFFGRKWNPALQLDQWFASDGTTVVCLKISGVSASIAMRMRWRFDDLRAAFPGPPPSRTTVLGLIEAIAREDAQFSTLPREARSRSRAIRG